MLFGLFFKTEMKTAYDVGFTIKGPVSESVEKSALRKIMSVIPSPSS
jgi:hypothetical protein